jgi:hypothetical protein
MKIYLFVFGEKENNGNKGFILIYCHFMIDGLTGLTVLNDQWNDMKEFGIQNHT